MGYHLYRFRKGWKGEHFAKFILSKFAFLAQPSTVSDDAGTDLFCTLFKVEGKDSLIPQNSFAIQIKTTKQMKFEITDKLPYLEKLEIPFFIGLVDLNKLKLTIYSGEYISNYFALGPCKDKTFVHLVDKRDEPLTMFEKDNYYIRFPKVVEIEADYDYISNPSKIADLSQLCRLVQQNISSKVNNEYLFKRFKSQWVDLYAGNTSIKHFIENFFQRLAEVFFNLSWIYKNTNYPKNEIKKDFEIYKKPYLELLSKHGSLPNYLTSRFDELKELIEKDQLLN